MRGAKQVITLRGPSGVRRGSALRDLGSIEDGSVLIKDGFIAAVGTSRRVENLKEARNALEIPVNGQIVMPGFVDASFSLGIDRAPQSPNGVRQRKKRSEFYDETVSLLSSCLQHGTLTTEVKANGDSLDLRPQFFISRQLARIDGNPVRIIRTCRVRRFPNGDDRTSKRFTAAVAALARRKLVQYLELDADPQSGVGSTALLRAAEYAKVRLKLFWPGGAPNILADHLTRLVPLTVCCPCDLSSEEFSVLSSARSIIVFSPTKEVFENVTPKCARDAIDAGAAIALSTGYDARYAPTFNMQMALALAVIGLRLTPEEAITAATINAAYATGCGDSVGSLEVGKRADLLVLNVPDYRNLHRQFGVNHVELAIRDGNIVFSRPPVKLSSR